MMTTTIGLAVGSGFGSLVDEELEVRSEEEDEEDELLGVVSLEADEQKFLHNVYFVFGLFTSIPYLLR